MSLLWLVTFDCVCVFFVYYDFPRIQHSVNNMHMWILQYICIAMLPCVDGHVERGQRKELSMSVLNSMAAIRVDAAFM
jgi:hypothetical protein